MGIYNIEVKIYAECAGSIPVVGTDWEVSPGRGDRSKAFVVYGKCLSPTYVKGLLSEG